MILAAITAAIEHDGIDDREGPDRGITTKNAIIGIGAIEPVDCEIGGAVVHTDARCVGVARHMLDSAAVYRNTSPDDLDGCLAEIVARIAHRRAGAEGERNIVRGDRAGLRRKMIFDPKRDRAWCCVDRQRVAICCIAQQRRDGVAEVLPGDAGSGRGGVLEIVQGWRWRRAGSRYLRIGFIS